MKSKRAPQHRPAKGTKHLGKRRGEERLSKRLSPSQADTRTEKMAVRKAERVLAAAKQRRKKK